MLDPIQVFDVLLGSLEIESIFTRALCPVGAQLEPSSQFLFDASQGSAVVLAQKEGTYAKGPKGASCLVDQNPFASFCCPLNDPTGTGWICNDG